MNNDILFDVSHEIVIITGISGQLGSNYAEAFLERGAVVIGLDKNRSPAIDTFIDKYQKKFSYIDSDITDKKSLNSALLKVNKIHGTPTVLINNAAIDSPPSAPAEENGYFENYPESSWDNVLNVNLKGTFLCCQVFGGEMAKQNKGGSIVNIMSIYGVVSPDQSLYEYRRKKGEIFYKPVAYSASKSGVANLTRYLAVYWAKKGIRVNSLTIAGVFNNQDAEFLDQYCSRIPIGRMAAENEYNGAVMFLASTASSYMTGSNLIIDGGWTSI